MVWPVAFSISNSTAHVCACVLLFANKSLTSSPKPVRLNEYFKLKHHGYDTRTKNELYIPTPKRHSGELTFGYQRVWSTN